MSNDVLKKVREIFEKAFGIAACSVSLDTNASDIPGWDSVGHLSLGALLEESFDVRFDVDDLSGMDNVRAIVRVPFISRNQHDLVLPSFSRHRLPFPRFDDADRLTQEDNQFRRSYRVHDALRFCLF